MGKRYYCDYCDRSFQDNMHNRKKHLFGVQHHRAKKAWFDNFRGIHRKLHKAVGGCKTIHLRWIKFLVFIFRRCHTFKWRADKGALQKVSPDRWGIWQRKPHRCVSSLVQYMFSVMNLIRLLAVFSGQCVFGTSCRFSHMSERQMKMLEQNIDGEVLQQWAAAFLDLHLMISFRCVIDL